MARLASSVRRAHPLRIVLGAGGLKVPGWIETDIDTLDLLDERSWRRWFEPDSVDAMLAEHVWEHLSADDGLRAARLCHRYLRPGGCLRLAVPDGLHPDPAYRRQVRPGGDGPGACDHRVLFTFRTLTGLLTDAGFAVELLEYFDEAGRFNARRLDPAHGPIRRSRDSDPRNAGGRLRYTSIIVDAVKPG
ncbi:MAG: methyltransferase domain-containing protein [Deltaproteobacteria bacterium]|nr:methyltransferase domain-containing protein [Deltaproteobacteria bacterium]